MAREEVTPAVDGLADDIPAITEAQNWAAHNHRQLYDAVHLDNDPGQAQSLADEWAALGAEIGDSAQVMAKQLRASESGWQGEAASAARSAMMELAQWSDVAAQTAAQVGSRIADQGQIAQMARNAMPEPVEFDMQATLAQGFTSGGLAGLEAAAADVKARSEQAGAAHEQAVAVMATMEADSRAVDRSVPVFVPPPNPIRGDTAPSQLMRDRMPATGEESTTAFARDGLSAPDPAFAAAGAGGSIAGAAAPSSVRSEASPAPAGYGGGDPGIAARYSGPGGSSSGFGGGTTSSQGAGTPTTPAFPSPSGPGPTMPSPDSYRPGATTPQGAPGLPGIGIPGDREPDMLRPSRPGMPPVPGGSPGGPLPPPYSGIPPRGVPGGDGPAGSGPQGGRGLGSQPPSNVRGGPPIPGGGSGPGGGGSGIGARLGGGGDGFGPRGPLTPGGAIGAGPVDGPGGRGVSGQPGGPGPAGSGQGGMGMGAGARGKGADDTEHKSKYANGEDLFEVPGANLPPSVIGGAKPKKQQG